MAEPPGAGGTFGVGCEDFLVGALEVLFVELLSNEEGAMLLFSGNARFSFPQLFRKSSILAASLCVFWEKTRRKISIRIFSKVSTEFIGV